MFNNNFIKSMVICGLYFLIVMQKYRGNRTLIGFISRAIVLKSSYDEIKCDLIFRNNSFLTMAVIG